jgi:hypothetical protein
VHNFLGQNGAVFSNGTITNRFFHRILVEEPFFLKMALLPLFQSIRESEFLEAVFF